MGIAAVACVGGSFTNGILGAFARSLPQEEK